METTTGEKLNISVTGEEIAFSSKFILTDPKKNIDYSHSKNTEVKTVKECAIEKAIKDGDIKFKDGYKQKISDKIEIAKVKKDVIELSGETPTISKVKNLQKYEKEVYLGDRTFGNAQNTDILTQNHKTAIEIIRDVHNQENSQNIIYLDRGLNRILGDKVKLPTNIRPDITVLKEDGSIKIIEIVSESQNNEMLEVKCKKAQTDIKNELNRLGMKEREVVFEVFEPKKVFEDHPELAKKYFKK